MKSIAVVIATAGMLLGGASLAQSPPATGPGAPATVSPAAPHGPAAAGTVAPTAPNDRNAAAAAGNNNQAVATTGANAPVPAKGANSFTMGEAKSCLRKMGSPT